MDGGIEPALSARFARIPARFQNDPGTSGGKKANVDLHERIIDALGAVDLENTRRFGRRTRSHRRAYCKVHSNDPSITREEPRGSSQG